MTDDIEPSSDPLSWGAWDAFAAKPGEGLIPELKELRAKSEGVRHYRANNIVSIESFRNSGWTASGPVASGFLEGADQTNVVHFQRPKKQ